MSEQTDMPKRWDPGAHAKVMFGNVRGAVQQCVHGKLPKGVRKPLAPVFSHKTMSVDWLEEKDRATWKES